LARHFKEAYLCENCSKWGPFLCSTKNERVNNFHPNFHIISGNFESLMELAMEDGEENKRNF